MVSQSPQGMMVLSEMVLDKVRIKAADVGYRVGKSPPRSQEKTPGVPCWVEPCGHCTPSTLSPAQAGWGGNAGRGLRTGRLVQEPLPRITAQSGTAIPVGSPSEECACVFGGTTVSPAPGFRPAQSRMNQFKPERPTPILPNPTATALV